MHDAHQQSAKLVEEWLAPPRVHSTIGTRFNGYVNTRLGSHKEAASVTADRVEGEAAVMSGNQPRYAAVDVELELQQLSRLQALNNAPNSQTQFCKGYFRF